MTWRLCPGVRRIVIRVGMRSRGVAGPWLLVLALAALAVDAAAQLERVNLAKYQPAQASSAADGDPAVYATDGIVGNGNRWKSDGAAPQWLIVTLPLAFELGSAHLYLGRDDIEPVASFSLQYWTGSTWAGIPGAAVSGNTANVLNVLFTAPVTTSRVRFYSNESVVRVRELALFAPDGPAGFPLGTDVTLNLAKKRPVIAGSVDGSDFGKGAVDGYVDDGARWKSADVDGPHTLEIDLGETSRVGSAHLYSGSATGPVVASFRLDAWNGSAWIAIPGGAVTNNAAQALAVTFTAPVETSRIRLYIPGNGSQRVRELVLFAANAAGAYPLGTDAIEAPPPASWFDEYGDGLWKIVNRSNPHSLIVGAGGASQTTATTSEEEKLFEVLYNLESDTYRLRNHDSYRCIGARNAGTTSGTAVVELPEYHGMPYELWRFEDVGGGDFRIVNVWNGLALQTDGGSPAVVTLVAPSSSTRQFWRFEYATHYPKKGTGGYEGDWARFGTSWCYNWGRDTSAGLPSSVVFAPMQHNRWWPDWNTLPEYYSGWHAATRPVCLLGFNEPDRSDQANMSVADVIALWPLLEAADMPLVSPVTANAYGGWLGDFYDQAASRGYRVDYTAVHWYSAPNAGNLIGHLQSVYSTWGRPVWLTEFSCVDWGGSATWTEEDNYRFLDEFMWRAEDQIWLKRYAVFLFSGDLPANPWDRVGQRSDVFTGDGTTLTPFGELYAAWDGDRVLREKTAYMIHGLAACHRLRASSTTNAPGTGSIRRSDVSTQWALVPAPVADRWYIVSLRDGRRLRFTGSVLDLAAPGLSGAAVQWAFNGPDGNGYVFIDHYATSKSLRLSRVNDGNGAPTSLDFGMEPFGTVADKTRWRFIKPFAPAEVAPPAAPTGLAAAGEEHRIVLAWSPSTASDLLHYSVYRGTTEGGPYTRIATALAAPNAVDTTALPDTAYRYVVTATDWIENESAYSREVAAALSAPQQPAFVRGDANTSDRLDIADAIFTLTHFFASGPAPSCLDAADANDDGKLDIADAIKTLGHLFALTGPLPAPFGTCGPDPTADALDCAGFPPCEGR